MVMKLLHRLLRRPFPLSHFHTTASSLAKVIKKFKLADIGEGITECEVIKWSVKPPAAVQTFDPLCEVQSDKASVEITSPFDGVVRELLVLEGEVAKVGDGLCLIEIDKNIPAAENTFSEKGGHSSSDIQSNSDEIIPSQGSGTSNVSHSRQLHPLDPNNISINRATSKDIVFAAPSVRHLARRNGVDLGLLAPGSGKEGRIKKSDVEAAIAGRLRRPSTQSVSVADQQNDVVVELGSTRYSMWKAMEKSLEIPHFGYSTTLDITALNAILPTLNSYIPSHYLPESSRPPSFQTISPSALYHAPSPPPVPESQQFTRITYLPFLLKTLSKAMIDWPLFRSSITPSSPSGTSEPTKPTLTIRPNADINIALSTPTGLYTPTLQSINTQSIYSLASQLKYLSHLGRQIPCALTLKEIPRRGGTLTVSNVGAIGAGEFAAPVLVPGGGVAIVAIGRAKWVWDVDVGDGKGERRLKIGVSWSGDHRVVEGAELAGFVEAWRAFVESPQRLIAEGV